MGSLLVAKYVGDGLLTLANLMLAPSDAAIALIKHRLMEWTDRESTQGFLLSLCEEKSSACSLSVAEMTAMSDALMESGRLHSMFQDVNGNRWTRYIGWSKRPGRLEIQDCPPNFHLLNNVQGFSIVARKTQDKLKTLQDLVRKTQ